MRGLIMAALLLAGCGETGLLTKIGNLAVQRDDEAEAIKEMQERAAAQFRQECWDSDRVKVQADMSGGVLIAGKPACGMMTGVDISGYLQMAAVKAIIESAKARYGPALTGVQVTITPPEQ